MVAAMAKFQVGDIVISIDMSFKVSGIVTKDQKNVHEDSTQFMILSGPHKKTKYVLPNKDFILDSNYLLNKQFNKELEDLINSPD